MALLVDTGKIHLLSLAIMGGMYCRLFINNVTVIETTQWSDLSEAYFDGYSYQSVGSSSGSIVGGKAVAELPEITFTCTGGSMPNTVYGWYICDTGSTVIWAENISPPVNIAASGDYVKITPTYTCRKDVC